MALAARARAKPSRPYACDRGPPPPPVLSGPPTTCARRARTPYERCPHHPHTSTLHDPVQPPVLRVADSPRRARFCARRTGPRLSLRVVVLLAVLAPVGSFGSASAQVATGEIYGKVTDASGAVLPGVTVTLTSPVLLQPLAGVTSDTGTYRFPLIPIGFYSARFDLAGFRTVVNEGIRIEIGLNAQINAALDIGGVEETVQVTGASPLVDLKDAGKTNRFTREALQAIPSARDPWVIIEQSAGVAMDRQNVGGSTSGQQGAFAARGTTRGQWNLDGVDITDMAATGFSPTYYDFDAFEEIQVTTAGADVTMQSSGLAINLVTKSGTDQLRGSGRYYVTDDAFQSNNVTDELRLQGVNIGNPIQNIRDYGIEAGGPLVKGRAWVWGSYGTQSDQRRHQQLLQAGCDLPGDEGRPPELLARGDPDLPHDGHDDPEELQPQVRVARVHEQPGLVLLQRRRQDPERP